jgi:hypothetical protein
MDLYELRTYVAKPGQLTALAAIWESRHHAIYADYHRVLGGFVATAADAAADGVALLLQHDDRAAVDRSLDGIFQSHRMNEVPGPPGTTTVQRWERTFLYPLDCSPMT